MCEGTTNSIKSPLYCQGRIISELLIGIEINEENENAQNIITGNNKYLKGDPSFLFIKRRITRKIITANEIAPLIGIKILNTSGSRLNVTPTPNVSTTKNNINPKKAKRTIVCLLFLFFSFFTSLSLSAMTLFIFSWFFP